MRRSLVLALTLALGLTALIAVPAAAGTRGDDGEDCSYVQTREGRQCLTDREIRQLRDKYRDRDRDKDRDRDRDRDLRLQWFRFLETRSDDSCGCLSGREMQRLLRLADDPDRRDTRRILRYLDRQDCFTDGEFRRVRRAARSYDGADLRRLIRNTADCDCTSDGRYWLTSSDYRRLDRHTNLNQRSLRRILRQGRDNDCITRVDVRRLDRRAGDLDFWDFFDILDRRGSL